MYGRGGWLNVAKRGGGAFHCVSNSQPFREGVGWGVGSELIIIFIINYHFHNLYRSQAGEVAGTPLTPWRLDNLAVGI